MTRRPDITDQLCLSRSVPSLVSGTSSHVPGEPVSRREQLREQELLSHGERARGLQVIAHAQNTAHIVSDTKGECYIYKWKNHFFKMKGGYRDGLKHQKGRNKGSLHSKVAQSYMTPSLYLCSIFNFAYI